jgi:hypothetical protein
MIGTRDTASSCCVQSKTKEIIMPHSPPVPPGNQSPYPIAETPHDDADTPETTSVENAGNASEHEPEDRSSRGGLAAILGIGALGALVAGLVAFTRSADAKTASRKKTKRSKG